MLYLKDVIIRSLSSLCYAVDNFIFPHNLSKLHNSQAECINDIQDGMASTFLILNSAKTELIIGSKFHNLS